MPSFTIWGLQHHLVLHKKLLHFCTLCIFWHCPNYALPTQIKKLYILATLMNKQCSLRSALSLKVCVIVQKCNNSLDRGYFVGQDKGLLLIKYLLYTGKWLE